MSKKVLNTDNYLFLNDLFSIVENKSSPGVCQIKIELNACHDIFKGHFPGAPVTPTGCIIQMVKESIMDAYDVTMELERFEHTHIFEIINPVEHPFIDFDISISTENMPIWQVSASVNSETTQHAEFSGYYKIS